MNDAQIRANKVRCRLRKKLGFDNKETKNMFVVKQELGDHEMRKLCIVTTKQHSSIEAVKQDLDEQIQAIKQEGWEINSDKRLFFVYH